MSLSEFRLDEQLRVYLESIYSSRKNIHISEFSSIAKGWQTELYIFNLGYIENGNKYRDACILAGISESTFQTWTKQGRDDTKAGKETEFSVFLAKIEQAKVKYKAWLISHVNKSAQMDGKLALEVLSRKYEEFRRKDNLKIDAKVTAGITMAEIHAAAEELEGEEE